jgi:hypothetical protein
LKANEGAALCRQLGDEALDVVGTPLAAGSNDGDASAILEEGGKAIVCQHGHVGTAGPAANKLGCRRR